MVEPQVMSTLETSLPQLSIFNLVLRCKYIVSSKWV